MNAAGKAALAAYLNLQVGVPDPWLLGLPDLPVEGQRFDMRMLLLAVVGQEISPAFLKHLLTSLEDELGEDLPLAGRLPFARLETAAHRTAGCVRWTFSDQLPGILLAVSDYLLAGEPLTERMRRQGPSAFVRDLALAVPFAGRRSPWRLRPWRLARWIVRGEGGFPGIPELRTELQMPPSVLARAWKFLGEIPPEGLPAVLQRWAQDFCRNWNPDDPAAAWVPLTLLRRPRGKVWACEERTGGCASCPLFSRCDPPPRN